ncbi:MAG: ABC transporter ATP-binding protein [Eubacteriales bacterium]|nr:ABC transporter ATP-binding protein [Eubacteriales bacterium]
MNKTLALEVNELVVNYGPIQAVKGISLKVPEGSIVALLGANGAGKSTTMKTISGLVKPASGSIKFFGEDITSVEPEKITEMGIMQSPEGRQVFYDLNVYENLMTGAYTIKKKDEIQKNLESVYRDFPVLEERKDQIAGTLSGGEQQMLAIARALMGSPRILTLDEPSLGLAPLIVKDIMKLIVRIRDSGVTVLLVEQNAKQTLKIADYAYVLELGRVSQEGNAQDLLDQSSLVVESYLGKV